MLKNPIFYDCSGGGGLDNLSGSAYDPILQTNPRSVR